MFWEYFSVFSDVENSLKIHVRLKTEETTEKGDIKH